MRFVWAAIAMMLGVVIASGAMAGPPANAQPATDGRPAAACSKDWNVDSCWRAGVAAERRGDAAAALAAYERSCAAGFQMGGCYEAGKIYFLNPKLRNYRASKDRMARVCESDDVGIGPYACTYLGILHRDGLTGKPRPDEAFTALARACFLHNAEPFIDGKGCAILADSVPGADAMGVSDGIWEPAYVSYLALAMGCSDDMPALCAKAQGALRRAVAQSAHWPARCAEDLKTAGFAIRCEDLAGSAAATGQRQQHRRRLVRLFNGATDYAG